MKEDKIKIFIKLPGGKKHKIELIKPLFGRKKMLYYNNKFAGFFSSTKIANRIREIIK